MFEPSTLSVDELSVRWQRSPRQILEFGLSLGIPLYCMFDGLLIDIGDHWLRHGGDYFVQIELDALNKSILANQRTFSRNARHETSEWEDRLDAEGVAAIRKSIDEQKRRVVDLNESMELRERARRNTKYSGAVRLAPKTIFDLMQSGQAPQPRIAFHPSASIHVAMYSPGDDAPTFPVWDGRMVDLESDQNGALPALTTGSVYVDVADVRSVEGSQRDASHPASALSSSQEAAAAPPAFQRQATREWTLNRPDRFPNYRKALFDFLRQAQMEGRPVPTAYEVLDAWRAAPPFGIVAMVDGIRFNDTEGQEKEAKMEAIAKAIKRLISSQ